MNVIQYFLDKVRFIVRIADSLNAEPDVYDAAGRQAYPRSGIDLYYEHRGIVDDTATVHAFGPHTPFHGDEEDWAKALADGRGYAAFDQHPVQ